MIGKLLFVDDDESSRRLVETALPTEGIEVSVAGNADEALESLGSDHHDLVLVRVPQAGVDDAVLIDKLKSKAPTVPVVVLAAAGEDKAAIKAVRSGAANYLTKPIDQDALVAIVHRALETRQLRNEVGELRQRVAELCSSVPGVEPGSSDDPNAPPVPAPGQSLRATAEEAARHAEKLAIVKALQVSRGNKSQAAKALKTDYKTLHVKMKALKIRAHDFKGH
jgi:DNA-binding NtrC family response regulator